MRYLILNSSPSRICLFSQKTLVWISGSLSSTPGFVRMSSIVWASIWTLQRIPCSHMKVKGGWRLVYCCPVTQSCPNLCDSMDCNIPGSPVLHCSPGVCSNSCPLNQWCHPTVSSSVTPFSCPQSFLSSESFPMSQFFAQVVKVLVLKLQHQSFQWIFRFDFL